MLHRKKLVRENVYILHLYMADTSFKKKKKEEKKTLNVV